MRVVPWLVWLAWLSGGCSFDAGGANTPGTADASVGDEPDALDGPDAPLPVDDGAVPDAPGPSIDATPPADAAPPDVACVTECVDGNTLFDCSVGMTVECPLGCDQAGGRCEQLVPSNGATVGHLAGVTADLVAPANIILVIDTDTGAIADLLGNSVRAAGTGVIAGFGFYDLGGGVAVLAVDSLTVPANGYLSAGGDNALIILSRGDVSVSGIIDVSAYCSATDFRCGGPGGGDGSDVTAFAVGCGAGGDGSGEGGPETGGGGGALGQAGAPGGDNGGPDLGGLGGVVAGCPGAELVPLVGGSGGGAGGGDSGQSGGDGGGGGGALQITSFGSITISGAAVGSAGVLAFGGGGKAGGGGRGGGGGGSGGAILLEAVTVSVTNAFLAANGGAGGQGGAVENGQNGQKSTTPAEGGGEGDGRGGDGGARNIGAEPGASNAMMNRDGTGGGGGGAGRVRVNAVAYTAGAGAIISPQESVGGIASE